MMQAAHTQCPSSLLLTTRRRLRRLLGVRDAPGSSTGGEAAEAARGRAACDDAAAARQGCCVRGLRGAERRATPLSARRGWGTQVGGQRTASSSSGGGGLIMSAMRPSVSRNSMNVSARARVNTCSEHAGARTHGSGVVVSKRRRRAAGVSWPVARAGGRQWPAGAVGKERDRAC